MKLSLTRISLALIAALSLGTVATAAERPLLQAGKKTLYQRILTKPDCTLADQVGAAGGTALPTFSRFYVYERDHSTGREWLKVGPDSYGKTVGWLPSKCTVSWKMQLTLAFTNPANREPMLFFKQRAALDSILDSSNPQRLVTPLRASLKGGSDAGGVVAQEPQFFIDLQKQFYLLPILSGEEVMTEEGFRTRVLKVASVTEKPGPSQVTRYIDNHLKEFSAAVVFVIDSSLSMEPHLQQTRQAMQDVYQRVQQQNLGEQVKFGLVAYRSDPKKRPGLEYLSTVLVDPNQVRAGETFLTKIENLQHAQVPLSYEQKDAFAGVMAALEKVRWDNFGARYLVLITDAGAVEGHDALSSTGLGAEQVRIEASKPGVAIYTLHLKSPAGRSDHARAQAQYERLSHYTPTHTSLYYPVDTQNSPAFQQTFDALTNTIISQVKAVYMGNQAVGSSGYAEGSDQLVNDTAMIGHAMQLSYLGRKTGTQAPSVFQAWISDRDLVKQKIPPTDVHELLTKAQLSDLSDIMKKILDAANEGMISSSEMFSRLRSVAATMGADPNQLQQRNSSKLSELGMLGEYLDDLPYQSEVLNLDEDTWKSWDGLAQEKFIRRLNTKLRHYRHYNSDVDRWVRLSPSADAREDVYPVPLARMP